MSEVERSSKNLLKEVLQIIDGLSASRPVTLGGRLFNDLGQQADLFMG